MATYPDVATLLAERYAAQKAFLDQEKVLEAMRLENQELKRTHTKLTDELAHLVRMVSNGQKNTLLGAELGTDLVGQLRVLLMERTELQQKLIDCQRLAEQTHRELEAVLDNCRKEDVQQGQGQSSKRTLVPELHELQAQLRLRESLLDLVAKVTESPPVYDDPTKLLGQLQTLMSFKLIYRRDIQYIQACLELPEIKEEAEITRAHLRAIYNAIMHMRSQLED